MIKALTIAGSDCSGGAGIQADLKTFTVYGVYGMSVITAITAQNTTGVFTVENISEKMVEAQMKNLTDPLEAEIQTTTSWWVKIRNRLYITLMQQAVKAIVADVKQKIA